MLKRDRETGSADGFEFCFGGHFVGGHVVGGHVVGGHVVRGQAVPGRSEEQDGNQGDAIDQETGS